jgi:hypothetical protein
MTQKINISIPQSCHENWEGMTAVDKGKFCASCQKKVFDFTKSSDREIVSAFDKNQNLCGRFLNTQLNRDLVKPNEKSSLWLATTATVVSFIGIGTHEAIAQQPVPTEQRDVRMLGKFIVTPPTEIEVSGVVNDKGGPLPGANISVKGTTKSTQTDFDGNFKIKAKSNDILLITFVGYDTTEVVVGENSKKINVTINDNKAFMGEIIVVKKRTFFGRLFRSIGNWFR